MERVVITEPVLPCEKNERCPYRIPLKDRERLKETEGSPCCTCYQNRLLDAQLEADRKQAGKEAQEGKQDIFSRIENISEVIDWEEDIGEMREMKEADYQALKKELGCV